MKMSVNMLDNISEISFEDDNQTDGFLEKEVDKYKNELNKSKSQIGSHVMPNISPSRNTDRLSVLRESVPGVSYFTPNYIL